jgi:(E)-4-hydroxy-3-methylbut-2-enyl-diphosphate synthase
MVEALVEEAERIMAEGIEARLAAADVGAAAEAEADREELLQIQGHDANHTGERIERIREIAD